jgi:hypothetical protein
MSVDLRACKPGQKLRLRNGEFAEYLGRSLGGVPYTHCVKYGEDGSGTRTDSGAISVAVPRHPCDITEIIPMTTFQQIPQRDTKDFTKYAISVMVAYDRGEEIESVRIGLPTWGATLYPAWDWSIFDYRIKPKPTVVPWTKETCQVGAVIKIKDTGNRYLILAAVDNHILMRESSFTYSHTLEHCTMDNGEPCGTVQQ